MKVFLTISQLIYALCLVPWLFVWGMSVMVFDAGIHFWNSFYFTIISLFPVAALGCSILAWILRVRRRRAAVLINLIPMLWIIGFSVILLAFLQLR